MSERSDALIGILCALALIPSLRTVHAAGILLTAVLVDIAAVIIGAGGILFAGAYSLGKHGA